MFVVSDSSEGLRAFAATVVHEVRTPLSSLRLCIEGLICAEGLSGRDRRRAELALGQIDHLEYLADQMRFLSAPCAPAPDPTDLNEVVRGVVQEMEEMASGRGVRVCARCAEGLPRVEAGWGPVRCILVNLCRNGIQAVDRTGVLRVWTRRVSPDGVELGVQDTGRGIPASDIDRVWDPFFTTRPEGMGVGLALVRAVAERQGGRVRLESEPGRGTTVTVWFRAC
jgi:signal transduction histidine kinase